MINTIVVDAVLEKLKLQAQQFEAEALATKDKFNKGYFEGKAEQNLKVIDMLGAWTIQEALEAIDE